MKCKTCGVDKDGSEFSNDPTMRSGKFSTCKLCRSRLSREYRARMRSNADWLANDRKRNRAAAKRRRERGIKPKNNQMYVAAWKLRNREKVRACWKARKAFERGLIKHSEKCEACGTASVPLERHHPDYSKPLEVQWLCRPCHGLTRRIAA